MPPEIRSTQSGAWVLVAPASRLAELEPLLSAHASRGPVRVIPREHGPPPTQREWAAWLDGAASGLFVGDRRYSPRTALPGPFVVDLNGRRVPIGWLPNAGSAAVATFASAAAHVVCRTGPPGPVALMSQWASRYLALTERMVANVRREDPALPVFRWTADRITRDDLVVALATGPGIGIYVGHGRPRGWAGYHGLRAHHLTARPGEPVGALLSMTCRTASRWGTGLSFSEAVVLGGAAAVAVGAVAPVWHLENMRWMLGLAAELGTLQMTLGAVLERAAPAGIADGSAYRIIGDPLTPIAGAAGAVEAGSAVWAPAPHDDLLATSAGDGP